MKAICINSSNKPKNIPISEWLVEGEMYTITKIVRMGFQKDVYGVKLKEIELTSQSIPYELYDATRFLPIDLLKEKQIKEEEIVKEADLELV